MRRLTIKGGYRPTSPDLRTVLSKCEGLESIIDEVQRLVQRPKILSTNKDCHNGKKNRHSLKNNIIADRRTMKIKGLSITCEGRKHDKKPTDEDGSPFPTGSRHWKTTGFQSYEAASATFQPKKKPRGGELILMRSRPTAVSRTWMPGPAQHRGANVLRNCL